MKEDEMVEWQNQLDEHQKMVNDLEAWHAAVQGVAKSRTQLSDSTTTIRFRLNTLGRTKFFEGDVSF